MEVHIGLLDVHTGHLEDQMGHLEVHRTIRRFLGVTQRSIWDLWRFIHATEVHINHLAFHMGISGGHVRHLEVHISLSGVLMSLSGVIWGTQ